MKKAAASSSEFCIIRCSFITLLEGISHVCLHFLKIFISTPCLEFRWSSALKLVGGNVWGYAFLREHFFERKTEHLSDGFHSVDAQDKIQIRSALQSEALKPALQTAEIQKSCSYSNYPQAW